MVSGDVGNVLKKSFVTMDSKRGFYHNVGMLLKIKTCKENSTESWGM